MGEQVLTISSTKNYIAIIDKNYLFMNNPYKQIKRVIDIVLSVMILIVFFVPILVIALLIKLEDKGTVLFKQQRTGKYGKIINVYKFRSMVMKNDVRNFKKEDQYTKIGSFIRKTSLDELPQIINILKGEMSFIGPRPWIPEYYENMNIIQKERVNVLPGITGLAQVSGRNGISVNDKINKDLEYIKNFSFKQDMIIMFKTVKTIFEKEEVNIGKMGIKKEIEDLKVQNNI